MLFIYTSICQAVFFREIFCTHFLLALSYVFMTWCLIKQRNSITISITLPSLLAPFGGNCNS